MRNNYLGMLIAVVITAGALSFVASTIATNEGSIQQQGETVIDRTASELTEIPEIIDEVVNEVDDSVSELPKTSEMFRETITAPEIVDDVTKEVDEQLPELPHVVEKSIGIDNAIRVVSINSGSSLNNCGDVQCVSPSDVRIERDGEIIWTNNDSEAHTINHGVPSSGPTGLFESDLIYPSQSYSISIGTVGEYDYFCILHPWLQGTISIY